MSKGPSLATKVAGIEIETCVFNASGPRTGSSAAMSKIAASESGAVLAKSATLASQTGNPQPRTWHETDPHVASLNSEGLPNSGIEYYIAPKTIEDSLVSTKKPYLVSISGATLADNLKMLDKICESVNNADSPSNISGVELNLACPNVIGKPIIAYDFDQMDSVLDAVSKLPSYQKAMSNKQLPLGVKMPPYFDGPHFEKAAEVLNKYKDMVRYVASINTIGNAFAVDTVAEMPVISSKGGFAGLSGPAVKYTALANVKKMRELLDESIDVVGVGGIQSGSDAFEMMLCGASAVQVGTCHWTEGPKCFDRICSELRDIMKSKGYTSVDDFKGKLKPWSKDGAAKSRAAKKAATTNSGDDKNSSKTSSGGSGTDMTMICAVLAVIIAVLLADKFGVVSI
uniref:Dihydroorotate dehydrogenase catalytic domain-containing protein n=1 Tax=Ditylum brightwellii TaxID=49249 RepID=A0A6U3QEU0_9STRA|mmetsp:Transcript_2054/g.3280  ORF Transcript_2054/g.3280 Transcript_2054/m.3280 type:complete len:399 (+) Transcript_2054:143-1339(+)